jgi:hypothetical protein
MTSLASPAWRACYRTVCTHACAPPLLPPSPTPDLSRLLSLIPCRADPGMQAPRAAACMVFIATLALLSIPRAVAQGSCSDPGAYQGGCESCVGAGCSWCVPDGQSLSQGTCIDSMTMSCNNVSGSSGHRT